MFESEDEREIDKKQSNKAQLMEKRKHILKTDFIYRTFTSAHHLC